MSDRYHPEVESALQYVSEARDALDALVNDPEELEALAEAVKALYLARKTIEGIGFIMHSNELAQASGRPTHAH